MDFFKQENEIIKLEEELKTKINELNIYKKESVKDLDRKYITYKTKDKSDKQVGKVVNIGINYITISLLKIEAYNNEINVKRIEGVSIDIKDLLSFDLIEEEDIINFVLEKVRCTCNYFLSKM